MNPTFGSAYLEGMADPEYGCACTDSGPWMTVIHMSGWEWDFYKDAWGL